MQYKSSKKILIDKRKLDTLLRLDCPKEIITDLIFENKLTLTGDSLIDDNLESLIDIKEFENWGGRRKGSGRPKKNQLENQDENQLENQDAIQDEDRDKDKDIEIDINKKIDYLTNPIINQVFNIYKTHCSNLTGLGKYYNRDVELKKQIGIYLEQTECNLDYFTRVCDIANRIKKIGSCKLDLKMVMNNHNGIYNGKYAEVDEDDDGYSSHDNSDWIRELEKKDGAL